VDTAIYTFSLFGPSFGVNDLCISDNANNTYSSTDDFGLAFSLPNGIKRKTADARNYFCGKREFIVEDYEVYKVI
jgi:hypothetical protein